MIGNRRGLLATLAVGAILSVSTEGTAQTTPLERLPGTVLDMIPPSDRVTGAPGQIRVSQTGCRSVPADGLRERIVDLAIQEWGYFGFTVVDETGVGFQNRRQGPGERRRGGVEPSESERVAQSIAGYWSVTADGAWIIERQNRIWQSTGVGRRWRDPWSAAFISWVMCEAGLADTSQFKRHIAHYAYIDQAIEARDGAAPNAAFTAYEVGEQPVEPGDLLCRARRGAYRTLDERRADLGVGARSHCDVVVKLEPDPGRVLFIGGNVRGSVRLKFLPTFAADDADPGYYEQVGHGDRVVFAHLKLAAPAINDDAFETSPTLEALRREPASIAALERRLAATSRPARTPASNQQPAG
jgi:hypothetical protein